MTTSTKAPTVNVKKLIELAEWAGAQDVRRRLGLPNEWEQGVWVARHDELIEAGVNTCGTACCIAGKAALEDGWVPAASVDTSANHGWWNGDDTSRVIKVDKKGKPVGGTRGVDEVAMEILGLTDRQARDLFSAGNNLRDIVTLVSEFIQGAKR